MRARPTSRSAWILVISMSRFARSEEHTSELQSRSDLVCRLLLEKKNNAFFSPISDTLGGPRTQQQTIVHEYMRDLPPNDLVDRRKPAIHLDPRGGAHRRDVIIGS